jgi:hypothetical protein
LVHGRAGGEEEEKRKGEAHASVIPRVGQRRTFGRGELRRFQRRFVVEKIGRNEACPCGSGKKYKRCCIGMSQAERNASILRAAGLPEDEYEIIELNQAMYDFIAPLLDEGGGSYEQWEAATTTGILCWQAALLDEQGRERVVKVAEAAVAESERSAFRARVNGMVERHRTMFPTMHECDEVKASVLDWCRSAEAHMASRRAAPAASSL